MRAVIVTAHFTAVGSDTRRGIARFARALREVDGLLSTCWLEGGSTYALVQTFDSLSSARAYLAGPLFASLSAIPNCRDVFVQQYSVNTGLNAMTVLAGDRPSAAAAGRDLARA